MSRGAPQRSFEWLGRLGLLVILALAAVTYREVLGLAHLGWDTWPMIATGRIQGARDLVETFSRELMDGRYPLGSFYRPVANLFFAADYALWGTAPRGYHTTDLAILLGASVLVFALARRLDGPRAPGLSTAAGIVGALLAAATLALHPLNFDALPVSARRADYLAVLFTLLTVLLSDRRGGVLRGLAVALAAFAAAGSKESGVVVVAVVFVRHLVAPVHPGPALRGALRRTVAPVVGVLVFVGLRTVVLRGLGGHPVSSIAGVPAHLPNVLHDYFGALAVPRPVTALLPSSLTIAWSVIALVGVGLVVVAVAHPRPLSEAGAENEARAQTGAGPRRTAGVLILWFAVVVLITGLSGEIRPWYAVPFLPAWGLLLGTVAAGAVRLAGQRRFLLALLPAAATLAILGVSARCHVLSRANPRWVELSGLIDAYLERVESRTASAPPGTRVDVRGLPLNLQMASGIADYGVQAWAELIHPERPLTCCDVRALSRLPQPSSDRVLVVLFPRRP